MSLGFDLNDAKSYLDTDKLDEQEEYTAGICRGLLTAEDTKNVLGWRDLNVSAVQMEEMKARAEEVREDADVFVIVGVGGSNQSARAMLEAIPGDGPETVYLGNTLSPYNIEKTLKSLEGKKVCIDVIAKNFETLEPGSHFRILRQWMRERYTEEEMRRRIILTGTSGSRLNEIADESGYTFLQFPVPIGGRYSAFTPVGIFPLMVAGLDVKAYMEGAERAISTCAKDPMQSPAIPYAAARNLLYKNGYDIEMLASFEPRLYYFSRWWWQLFGESEGKENTGVFPTTAIYSEDLHSIGQYMQEGRRNLFETFVSVDDPGASAVILPDPGTGDAFDYLDNVDFAEINKKAEDATIFAHSHGGVPCLKFTVDRIDERMFGELYYTMMMACACSGILNGIDPFSQDGVEAYKRSMFKALGRDQ